MKYIAIIFSIIFSIVSLILGQFIYPLIASFFDTLPNMFSFISKFLIWITISILTLKLTKENRVRLGIIFPYTVSLIISIILGVIRFGGSHYENGYIVHHGDLRNNIGMEVISGSDWYSHYFKCIDKNGNNIIVECWREEDENYENDSYGENIYIQKTQSCLSIFCHLFCLL